MDRGHIQKKDTYKEWTYIDNRKTRRVNYIKGLYKEKTIQRRDYTGGNVYMEAIIQERNYIKRKL